MCDYSLEHLRSVKAREGESYKMDDRVVHGFTTKDSSAANYSTLTIACVAPGQRLQLTGIQALPPWGNAIPRGDTVIATVVQQRQDPRRYAHFGPFQDGVLFDNGAAIPIAWLGRCTMTVLPVEQPKPKRSLSERLGLSSSMPKARELEDAD